MNLLLLFPWCSPKFKQGGAKGGDKEDLEALLFWLQTVVGSVPCGASGPWWNPSAAVGAGALKVGGVGRGAEWIGSEPPPLTFILGAGGLEQVTCLSRLCYFLNVRGFFVLVLGVSFCIWVPCPWWNGALAHPSYNCEQDDVKIFWMIFEFKQLWYEMK
jgi:hypothetical protein